MIAVGGVVVLGGAGYGALTIRDGQAHETQPVYEANTWHNLPADSVFPGRLKSGNVHDSSAWARLGIDRERSCGQALESKLAKYAARHGCRTALRATYSDPTRWTVATVTLIVADTPANGKKIGETIDELGDQEKPYELIHAYPVPGTIATNFSDGRRNAMTGEAIDAPTSYAVGVTVGATDGRAAGHLRGPWSVGGSAAQNLDRDGWVHDADDIATRYANHLRDLDQGEAG